MFIGLAGTGAASGLAVTIYEWHVSYLSSNTCYDTSLQYIYVVRTFFRIPVSSNKFVSAVYTYARKV
jgi:hypothetical protein